MATVTLETGLLMLRIAAGILLLAFLGALFWVLWRDYRTAARVVLDEKRQRGRLVVIVAGVQHAALVPDTPMSEYPGLDEGAGVESLAGMSFPLLPVTSVGRAPTNTIVLPDTFCSQEHALVSRRDGQWWLEDLRSSNGTLLNGEPVVEPVVVSSGDVIGIGRVQLKVELE